MVIYGILAGRFQPFHAGHYAAYQQMCKYFGEQYIFVATTNKTDNLTDPLTIEDKKKLLSHFIIPEDRLFVTNSPFKPIDLFLELSAKTPNCAFAICSYSDKCLKLLSKNMKELPLQKEAVRKYDPTNGDGVYYFKISSGKYKIDDIDAFNGLSIENSEDKKKKYFLYLYNRHEDDLYGLIDSKFGGRIMSNKRDFDDPKYKAWRLSVLARDGYACQWTGKKGGKLEVHHIERWVDRPDLRYDTTNGITLSEEIHRTITGKEKDFAPRLKELVAERIKQLAKQGKKFDRARSTDNQNINTRKRTWIPRSARMR